MEQQYQIEPILSRISEDDSANRSIEISNCANIRRNVGLQYRVSAIGGDQSRFTTEVYGSPEVEIYPAEVATIGAGEHVPVSDETKPVIHDVRLLKKSPLLQLNVVRRPVNRTYTGLDLPSRASSTGQDCLQAESHRRKSRLGRTASTFGNVTHKNIFIGIGEYRTLLRPETDSVATAEVIGKPAATRHVTGIGSKSASVKSITSTTEEDRDSLTLPQSLAYGDDTLRAIALITEKFDSFRRRQQRVRSFLHSRSVNSSLRSRGTQRDNSICSGTSVTIASSGGSVLRVATDHGFVVLPWATDNAESSTGHVTATEAMRARLFYSSVSTKVVTCQSLADVFLGACATSANGKAMKPSSTSGANASRSDSTVACTGWIHIVTGIPTLVLSTGVDGRGRRELAVIVADRQTGFPIWRDRVSYLSDYHEVAPGVHAMRVSGGLTKRVKFDIFNRTAADDFLASYRSMTSDPSDELWKMSADAEVLDRGKPGRRRKHKNTGGGVGIWKTLTTADISQPCNPRWVTRIDANDSNFRSAFNEYLPALLPVPANNEIAAKASQDDVELLPSSTEEEEEDFRPRLPTN